MTTTIETPATKLTLTAIDLKALKQADSVSFHHYKGESSIVARKQLKNAGPFDDRERKHEFNVHSVFQGKLSEEFIEIDNVSCFESLHCSKYSEEWQTIVAFLRIGDEITLHWYADGFKNGYVEHAKMESGHCEGMKPHADALYFKIKRGEKRFSFLVAVSFCPDNTARMIRHA